MTLNLTELRDEPLGTPTVRDGGRRPFSMMVCYIPPMCVWAMTDTEMALGDAADGEGVFKIDVDGLSDEVLDHGRDQPQRLCLYVRALPDHDNGRMEQRVGHLTRSICFLISRHSV